MAKKELDATKNVELVERIAGVTEELEDILAVSKGADIPSLKTDLKEIMKSSRKALGTNIHPFLFSIFKLLAIRGLVRGRMSYSAYHTGKDMGENLGIKNTKDLQKFFKKLGLGKLTVVRCKDDDVVIKLFDDITCMGLKNLNKPICFFEAGLLAGALEKLLRVRVDLEETKCKAMKHSCCQFELIRLKEGKMHRGSVPILPPDIHAEENIKLLTTLASHAISAIENALVFEKTKRQAVVDGLTQAYNHRFFQQIIKVETKRSHRHRTPLSLIMIDIDNFKKYNDTQGHQQGDEVLKSVVSMLMSNVREIDMVARYGGDEMVVILPQTNESGAKIVAKRIKRKMSEQTIVKRSKVRLSLSQGITTYNAKSKKEIEPEQIIKRADKALFSAKAKGRNKIVFLGM